MKYSIEYFHVRVREEIEDWPCGILADYARIVELLMEFGPHLPLPYSRALGTGLFELKPRRTEGTARVFYCFLVQQRVVILHTFVKKTRKTPERELKLARRRMKEITGG